MYNICIITMYTIYILYIIIITITNDHSHKQIYLEARTTGEHH